MAFATSETRPLAGLAKQAPVLHPAGLALSRQGADVAWAFESHN